MGFILAHPHGGPLTPLNCSRSTEANVMELLTGQAAAIAM
jgi:hypothetical protein